MTVLILFCFFFSNFCKKRKLDFIKLLFCFFYFNSIPAFSSLFPTFPSLVPTLTSLLFVFPPGFHAFPPHSSHSLFPSIPLFLYSLHSHPHSPFQLLQGASVESTKRPCKLIHPLFYRI